MKSEAEQFRECIEVFGKEHLLHPRRKLKFLNITIKDIKEKYHYRYNQCSLAVFIKDGRVKILKSKY